MNLTVAPFKGRFRPFRLALDILISFCNDNASRSSQAFSGSIKESLSPFFQRDYDDSRDCSHNRNILPSGIRGLGSGGFGILSLRARSGAVHPQYGHLYVPRPILDDVSLGPTLLLARETRD